MAKKEEATLIINKIVSTFHKIGIMLLGTPHNKETILVWKESERESRKQLKNQIMNLIRENKIKLKRKYTLDAYWLDTEELTCIAVYAGIKFINYITLNLPDTFSLLENYGVKLKLVVNQGSIIQGFSGSSTMLNISYMGRTVESARKIAVTY